MDAFRLRGRYFHPEVLWKMQRIPGWCALLGWVVIPGAAACLVLGLPREYRDQWPLWIFDCYFAGAGLLFLSGTAVGIRNWRCRAGRGATVSAALCLIGLLVVMCAATVGFRATVGYDTRDSVGIGAFAGPGRIAFAASSPPELSEGRVRVILERSWLWHSLGEKHGYADATGALVIPIRFEWAWAFEGGFANVYEGGVGFINRQGA